MEEKVKIKGRELKVNPKRANFNKWLKGQVQVDTSTLVFYAPEQGSIFIDEQATDSYAKWATTHELICQGSHKGLAPHVGNPDRQCGAIDKMLLRIMPEEERDEYLEKRITMFQTLLETGLNPTMEPRFRSALLQLKELRKERRKTQKNNR